MVTVSTKQRQLDHAKKTAAELYDRARFRQDEGIPQKSKRFDVLARSCIAALELEISQGIRRETNRDYKDLSTRLPPKPDAEAVKVISEMFEGSVDGEWYDPERWGQYFAPYGLVI